VTARPHLHLPPRPGQHISSTEPLHVRASLAKARPGHSQAAVQALLANGRGSCWMRPQLTTKLPFPRGGREPSASIPRVSSEDGARAEASRTLERHGMQPRSTIPLELFSGLTAGLRAHWPRSRLDCQAVRKPQISLGVLDPVAARRARAMPPTTVDHRTPAFRGSSTKRNAALTIETTRSDCQDRCHESCGPASETASSKRDQRWNRNDEHLGTATRRRRSCLPASE